MAIPSRQIGWGTQANLLWQISKQLERLICVASCECNTTTTTTTAEPITTTTTTLAPLVLVYGYYYADCSSCPPNSGCLAFESFLFLEQACVDLITVGCHIYGDPSGTTNASQGYYERWDGIPGYLYIDANGLVANIDVCPQP